MISDRCFGLLKVLAFSCEDPATPDGEQEVVALVEGEIRDGVRREKLPSEGDRLHVVFDRTADFVDVLAISGIDRRQLKLLIEVS